MELSGLACPCARAWQRTRFGRAWHERSLCQTAQNRRQCSLVMRWWSPAAARLLSRLEQQRGGRGRGRGRGPGGERRQQRRLRALLRGQHLRQLRLHARLHVLLHIEQPVLLHRRLQPAHEPGASAAPGLPFTFLCTAKSRSCFTAACGARARAGRVSCGRAAPLRARVPRRADQACSEHMRLCIATCRLPACPTSVPDCFHAGRHAATT